ncbi:hypothetical protein [Cohnella zeiphila]|uniref:Uncharacterized protein n=1 Tax=Cohnella zeiphila TaxID=2761120 RepID=A0A7X0SGH8_9BACL|nr:hypothetical protein [Cohnella zeiphila]MBB6729552.1 hypothetical protein [Cohnella zeiphila]
MTYVSTNVDFRFDSSWPLTVSLASRPSSGLLVHRYPVDLSTTAICVLSGRTYSSYFPLSAASA